jgi:hypothetical protein
MGDRMHGVVAQLHHDDFTWATHASLADFLAAVDTMPRIEKREWDHIVPSRGVDALAARAPNGKDQAGD